MASVPDLCILFYFLQRILEYFLQEKSDVSVACASAL